ncbi:MAG: PHP domain-containing protein [Haloarculaceae archaeon]
MRDFHSHSNYSDGELLWVMIRAAQEAGLDGVGIADHCWLAPDESARDYRASLGFTMDETYERRRRGIDLVREEADIPVYDAVEMDYEPGQEGRIGAFLETAGFDYAVGSVHGVEGRNLQRPRQFEGMTDDELDGVVDRYFENLASLAASELFDIAAHPDLVERNPLLSGRAEREHYERAAAAFADSRTVPEVNAGRALEEDGQVHPVSTFLETLREYDVSVTVGTDSHHPEEYGPRAEFLSEFAAERDLDPVAPPGLDP